MQASLLRRIVSGAVLGFAAIGLLTGCGSSSTGGPTQSETKPVTGGKETLKARLQEIASSGIGGSAVSGMREGLQELKSTDPALADDLLKDLGELERLQDSEKIKAQASKMAAKL